ncbi:hypothetical protein ATK17_2259 [Branchiibius hedensis]|uniref:Uncharacterized protein n=1 Tax=Branchiibius hedensis TaxID=672460 RepID=A0A2Y8ZYE5_9MICO|nr:hypothetical protein ATK17_2259 [Branchiibius hedensis]SSA34927.1 hypothetical protein SAMN04489750_2259 [Branchiibius hedensis]
MRRVLAFVANHYVLVVVCFLAVVLLIVLAAGRGAV